MGQDLREAVRSLARTPLLSALVVLSLGLGIGMNTAVFSVVSAVLLKPMDYTDPERLVQIRGRFASDGVEDALLPGAVLSAVRRGTSQLQDVAGVAAIRQNLTGPEIPVQVQVGWVSTNFFRMLGVAPALGRGFADDEPPGRLLLSDAFWRRHFAADPGVAGRGVALDGRPYEIVGVMPAGFRLELPRLPGEIDVWKVPDDWWQNGKVWESTDLGAGILRLVGRLAPGATPQSARAELEAVSARLREGRPELARSGFALAVDPLHDAVVSRVRTTLWLLLGAAGSVLLIACANVANLQLVRGRRRAREIAVRLALGASRRRVVRLLLAEALLLAFLGGAMGVVLGSAGLDLLLHLRPSDLPRADAIRLDAAVLAFAAASCLGATLLFGLLPALAATRRDVAVDLHGARSPLGPDRRWAGASLVAAQVGLSLVLLLGGGVLAFSLHRLHAVPLGLDTDRLLTFSVSLPGTRYDRPLGTDAFLTRLEGSLRALPGVRAAGPRGRSPCPARVGATSTRREPSASASARTPTTDSRRPRSSRRCGSPSSRDGRSARATRGTPSSSAAASRSGLFRGRARWDGRSRPTRGEAAWRPFASWASWATCARAPVAIPRWRRSTSTPGAGPGRTGRSTWW
jgi:putative ABC transport system permease protein